MSDPSLSELAPPLVIGATCGSGSRVMVRIVRHTGRFMGWRVNHAEDAQSFRLFLHRWIDQFTPKWIDGDAIPEIEEMATDFRRCVRNHRLTLLNPTAPWGWKNPRSIYVLPFLHRVFPGLRYLHVVRDGRDMAFAGNQNGLKWHAATLLNSDLGEAPKPVRSIALWSRVNTATAAYGEQQMGDRYLRVRLEDLVADPEGMVRQLCRFSGEEEVSPHLSRCLGMLVRDFRCSPPDAVMRAWRRLRETGKLTWTPVSEVEQPGSLGRWRQKDPALIRELESRGEPGLRKFGYL